MSSQRPPVRVAVVGHVEHVLFARAPHAPSPGEIVHARVELEEPAGGGAVAAVQLARLTPSALLLTALGDDERGQRCASRLRELGVTLHAAPRASPTRHAVTLLDDAGERTITTFGERQEPRGDDPALPWDLLADADAVYFTAGDLAALRAARAARILVASPRAGDALAHGVPLDALVLSSRDQEERRRAESAAAAARLTVLTEGARGGSYTTADARSGNWSAAALPGPVRDSYGCGDSFAAGLAYALALGFDVEGALALAARCGATCLTGRGPYERQLVAAEL